MSFILDALRKSELERRAGSVCGLSPGATYVVAADGGSRRAGAAILAAVGLLGAGLVLGAWRPWQSSAAAEPIRTATVPPATPIVSPAEVPLPPPVPPLPAAEAPPARVKTDEAAKVLAPLRSGAAIRKAAQPAARPAPRPAATAEAGNRVVAYGDLPAELQSRLPTITFGGYAGTDEAETRIAFINNRLVKEGEEVSPGVKLEEVGPAGVVLGFQGYRFRPAH